MPPVLQCKLAEDLLDVATEWTSTQETQLAELFEGLEAENGHVTNVLAGYARTTGL